MAVPYVKQTWTDGSGGGTPVSAARLNYIETGIYEAQRMPAARVYNTANIPIASGAATAVTYTSERYDTDAIHDIATNNSRLTCKTAGIYSIVGRIMFAANVTGTRQLDLRLNGTTVIDTSFDGGPTVAGCFLKVVAQYQLAVNDYVELVAYQSSGANLNILTAGNYSPEFEMVRVST